MTGMFGECSLYEEEEESERKREVGPKVLGLVLNRSYDGSRAVADEAPTCRALIVFSKSAGEVNKSQSVVG